MTDYALWSRVRQCYAHIDGDGTMYSSSALGVRWIPNHLLTHALRTVARTNKTWEWEFRTREEVEQAEQT